jgi:Na+-driven multidrug efflux pump
VALLLLTAIRLALAFAGLGAATAVTSGRAAVLGFVLGAIGCTLFVIMDPRRRFMSVPAVRRDLPWWKRALRATLPSTVGVAVLCAVALAFSGVLAAICAGILAGLAIGGVVAALAF